jgi:hypothetical protein
MFGKSKSMLQVSSFGEWRDRVRWSRGFSSIIWTAAGTTAMPAADYMYIKCKRCNTERTTGLGGDAPAATPSDLCVGAKMDGWVLNNAGQWCEKCSLRPWTRYVSIPRKLMDEAVMRFYGGNLLLSALTYSTVTCSAALGFAHLLAWLITNN